MKLTDFFLDELDREAAGTRKALQNVPEGRNDWKPHEKSMPFGRLAMHCATIPLFGHYIIEDDGMDMAASKRSHFALEWKGRDAALAALDDAAQQCRASLVSASDETLQKPWRFSFGEQLIGEAPRAAMFRNLFFDHMIHHVAQLGVYLRLNNIAVPGLYGPSADEQWSPK